MHMQVYYMQYLLNSSIVLVAKKAKIKLFSRKRRRRTYVKFHSEKLRN